MKALEDALFAAFDALAKPTPDNRAKATASAAAALTDLDARLAAASSPRNPRTR